MLCHSSPFQLAATSSSRIAESPRRHRNCRPTCVATRGQGRLPCTQANSYPFEVTANQACTPSSKSSLRGRVTPIECDFGFPAPSGASCGGRAACAGVLIRAAPAYNSSAKITVWRCTDIKAEVQAADGAKSPIRNRTARPAAFTRLQWHRRVNRCAAATAAVPGLAGVSVNRAQLPARLRRRHAEAQAAGALRRPGQAGPALFGARPQRQAAPQVSHQPRRDRAAVRLGGGGT